MSKIQILETEMGDLVDVAKYKELEKENAALRKKLAVARKDAERYCHVRKNPAMLLHLSNKVFDEAIDAAIAKEGK